MMRFSTLAPAGGFPSPWRIASTSRLYRLCSSPRARASEQLALVLSALTSAAGTEHHEVLLYGSGKAALTTLLTALKERSAKNVVLLPAYTCPDVAAAALRAGFKPHLIDVTPETLELRPESISSGVLSRAAGVVLTNLYGMPDALEFWQGVRNRNPEFFIIDDACQAFQNSGPEGRAGARQGTLGVLSFGRGKSLCAAGGGAVIVPAAREAVLLNRLRSKPPEPVSASNLRTLALSGLTWLLERPFLYTFPASIPGLRLGETSCDLQFPLCGIGEAEALAALSLTGQLDHSMQSNKEKMLRYESALAVTPGVGLPSLRERARQPGILPVLLRFPLILPSAPVREQLLTLLRKHGLGANASYPKPLSDFPEFDGSLEFEDIQGARSLAERILTLPLHRYVTERMQKRMTDLINAEVGAEPAVRRP